MMLLNLNVTTIVTNKSQGFLIISGCSKKEDKLNMG